jgi:RNA polymerase sigma factor (sigma-70 family)
MLVRYARRMLGGHAGVVDDVVQEALLRASRALHRDERRIMLKPWLLRLVRNCCLDELSRVRTDSVELGVADAAGLLVNDESTLIERRGRVRELLVDLATLPDLQRHALVRRELDGLSHERSRPSSRCR